MEMRFLCNNCDQKLHTKHFWVGMSVTCPSCGKQTELSYREGQEIPNIEYSISFRAFKQLLTDAPYSKAIDPIVKKLLGCSIQRTEAGVKLVGEDGSLIPLEVAHLEIQSDRDSQRIIYGAAMDQWR
jgi:hypothetical protein